MKEGGIARGDAWTTPPQWSSGSGTLRPDVARVAHAVSKGNVILVQEIYRAFAERRFPVEYLAGEVPRSCIDVSLTRKQLGGESGRWCLRSRAAHFVL
jgi:hypothetical protein